MARRWNHRRARRARVSSTHILLGAGAIGALAGIGSIGTTPEGRAQLYDVASEASVASGLARERAPERAIIGADAMTRAPPGRPRFIAASQDIAMGSMPTTTASLASPIAANSEGYLALVRPRAAGLRPPPRPFVPRPIDLASSRRFSA